MEKLYGFLAVIVLLVLITLVRRAANRPRGSKEIRTGHATVISRRVDQSRSDVRGSSYASSRGLSSTWKYLVSFDLGALQLELEVGENDYTALKEGLSGQLEWQYEYLVSFTPDTAQ